MVEEKPVEEVIKTELPWKRIAFDTARVKYKFIIYSRRVGSGARYKLSQKELYYPWNKISQDMPPKDTTLEELKTKEMTGIRICRFGIPEPEGTIIFKKKEDVTNGNNMEKGRSSI